MGHLPRGGHEKGLWKLGVMEKALGRIQQLCPRHPTIIQMWKEMLRAR